MTPAPSASPPTTRRDPLYALALFAGALVVYWPALTGDVVWDDDAHVTRGALQSVHGLWRIWSDLGATQQYYPVLHSAFWLEHRLWGDAVLGYHLANVALHALAACLVVVLCQRLAIRGAWVAGMLFALHPVAVESVAWMSEQKNTLSTVFYLMAAIGWQQWDTRRRSRDYLLATLLFVLALGTKTVTATLPGALLVAVWWQRGRIDPRRDLLPLLPWFMLATSAGLTTAWVERHVIGASGPEFALSGFDRVLLAARATWHYLATLAWPASLVFTYPRWLIDARDTSAYAYVATVVGIATVLWMLRTRWRAPFAALVAFIGALFPVLGFLAIYPFRYAWVADHFQYQADIALFMLAGSGIALAHDRLQGARRAAWRATIVLLVVALGALSWRQAGHYRDAETLYRATLAVNPSSWMAHHNLGRIVSRKPGGLPEAIMHYEAAIAIKPDHARANYALGVALVRSGRGAEAVPHFEAAIRDEPGNAPLVGSAEYMLGVEDLKRPDGAADAVRHFAEAVRRKPGIDETARALAGAQQRLALETARAASPSAHP